MKAFFIAAALLGTHAPGDTVPVTVAVVEEGAQLQGDGLILRRVGEQDVIALGPDAGARELATAIEMFREIYERDGAVTRPRRIPIRFSNDARHARRGTGHNRTGRLVSRGSGRAVTISGLGRVRAYAILVVVGDS